MSGTLSHPRIHSAIHGAERIIEMVEDMRPFLHLMFDNIMPPVMVLTAIAAIIGMVNPMPDAVFTPIDGLWTVKHHGYEATVIAVQASVVNAIQARRMSAIYRRA